MQPLGTFFKVALLLFVTSFSAVKAQNQVVNLTISNIKSTQGQILLAVFADQKGFKDEVPIHRFRFPKTAISNGTMKVSVNLAPGTYGIALVDDDNKNGKLDKNMIGIPKEGIGFSNFYLSGMSKPDFDDFKFEVKNSAMAIQSKMRNF